MKACPEADGQAGWDEWYKRDQAGRTLAQQLAESPHDYACRAFLAGWAARLSAPEAGKLLGHTIVAHSVMSCLQSREDAENEAAAFLSTGALVAEVRAVDTGEAIRARRKAADDLAALIDELGLYDDRRGEP